MIAPSAARADLATLLARFGNALRAAGVPISPTEFTCLAQVIETCHPDTVADLYWCARVSLLRSTYWLDTFDQLFAAVFQGIRTPPDRVDPSGISDLADFRGDTPPPVDSRRASAPAEHALAEGAVAAATDAEQSGANDAEVVLHPVAASYAERLSEIDFAQLTVAELEQVAVLLRGLVTSLPPRTTRRRRRDPHGDRMDVRATLRRGSRSGGDPIRVVRRSRLRRPRRLVALLDISGSMEPYARAYLHLLWGAAVRADAEVFVFGTRLTRITRPLRVGQPDLALARAAAVMPDWSGGTRIGRAVKGFMDGWGRRGMAHGAVVLIVSDGWERDDPQLLRAQIEALSRRAHRLVWANPRSAAPSFQPTTQGMSAVLPFLDVLISGHSAASMRDVIAALGADQPAAY